MPTINDAIASLHKFELELRAAHAPIEAAARQMGGLFDTRLVLVNFSEQMRELLDRTTAQLNKDEEGACPESS